MTYKKECPLIEWGDEEGKIEKNKGLMDAEEEKRKSIKKDKEDEKENTDGNADFFTKRK